MGTSVETPFPTAAQVWVMASCSALFTAWRGGLVWNDRFERGAFRLHADMAVVHLLRDVPGDVHDGLIARAAFGQVVMSVCRLSCQRP